MDQTAGMRCASCRRAEQKQGKKGNAKRILSFP